MWQLLLAGAVAVAGSGFLAKNLIPAFAPKRIGKSDDIGRTEPGNANQCPDSPEICSEYRLEYNELTDTPITSTDRTAVSQDDAIFRFSSLGPRDRSTYKKKLRKRLGDGPRESNGNADQKVEIRSGFRLKRRKVARNRPRKWGFCFAKDKSLFSWGLGVGMMYMTSVGKAEINKLNMAVDETAKVVKELKTALSRRKPPALEVDSSLSGINESPEKVKSRPTQPMLLKSSPKSGNYIDARISGIPSIDDGEYASSVLTEEPGSDVLEMDQLEAELESEMQKLSCCETEGLAQKIHEPGAQFCRPNQSEGVLPFELHQKLSHLLIEQQESQIMELESKLQFADSKLHEKEAELEELKAWVRRLTEFSSSDDESEAHVVQEVNSSWDQHRSGGSNSLKSMVGLKRAIGSEPVGRYVE